MHKTKMFHTMVFFMLCYMWMNHPEIIVSMWHHKSLLLNIKNFSLLLCGTIKYSMIMYMGLLYLMQTLMLIPATMNFMCRKFWKTEYPSKQSKQQLLAYMMKNRSKWSKINLFIFYLSPMPYYMLDSDLEVIIFLKSKIPWQLFWKMYKSPYIVWIMLMLMLISLMSMWFMFTYKKNNTTHIPQEKIIYITMEDPSGLSENTKFYLMTSFICIWYIMMKHPEIIAFLLEYKKLLPNNTILWDSFWATIEFAFITMMGGVWLLQTLMLIPAAMDGMCRKFWQMEWPSKTRRENICFLMEKNQLKTMWMVVFSVWSVMFNIMYFGLM